jgi:hypothetical protein
MKWKAVLGRSSLWAMESKSGMETIRSENNLGVR